MPRARKVVWQEESYRVRADLPTLDKVIDIEQFLDWLYEVERFFDIMNVKLQRMQWRWCMAEASPRDAEVKRIAHYPILESNEVSSKGTFSAFWLQENSVPPVSGLFNRYWYILFCTKEFLCLQVKCCGFQKKLE